MKDAFPGFRRAVQIFAVYLVAEQMYTLANTPIDRGHVDTSNKEWKKGKLGQPPHLDDVEGGGSADRH
jgi:hypothetical protein